MKHTLKGWLADSHLVTAKPGDKLLLPEPAGNLALDDIFNEMRKEDTGLRMETIEHAVKLFNRVTARLIMNGYAVNTGLFRAAPQFRGVIENGQWDPDRNSIGVSFAEDRDLREAMAETTIDILGLKGDVMYITSGEDTATHAADGTATAGHAYILRGRMLKIAGDPESAGVTLTAADGATTRLTPDRIVVNKPSQLMIQLPDNLPEGEYTLTVTTYFSDTKRLLKAPRVTTKTITII